MTERRRGLGRGLGALIPTGPADDGGRPSDLFFRERHPNDTGVVSRETGSVLGDPAGGGDPAEAMPTSAGPVQSGPRYAGPTYAAPAYPASGDGGPVQEPVANAAGTGLREVPGARYAEVPLELIRPNPRQPRTVFDPDELAELVASIREIGVLQPVVVRPLPEGSPADTGNAGDGDNAGNTDGAGGATGYELVMGERRWRAAGDAGLETIPAIVKETSDDAMLRDALLENLHRSQLNPLEEAAAYQQLLDDFGCTHDDLAARIGRSRPQISNTLRLLRLPPLVARRLAAGVLSAGHARALLGLEDGAAMERLAQRIVAEGLSVRSVEEIVALGGEGVPTPRRQREPQVRDGRLDEVAARLSDRFDTRVSVAMGQRKGRLTVEFATLEDLDRIVALLDS